MEETRSVVWRFYLFPPDRQVNISMALDYSVADLLHNGNKPAWAAIIEFIETKIAETEEDDEWT